MTLMTFLLFVVFLIGLYFYSNPKTHEEGFRNQTNLRCPNILIQKGSRFYLYNSKIAKVPGVNPVEFENLEDYTEFLDWQRSQGIRCPVLYLQQTYDTQGKTTFKIRPSVSEMQGGLPPSNLGIPNMPAYPNQQLLVDASKNDAPYNQGSMPAYDQTSYYVGTTTPLDNMDIEQAMAAISANPMDPNWGGADYTQSLVDQGYYADNEVSLRV
jgi:hypothetical protein